MLLKTGAKQKYQELLIVRTKKAGEIAGLFCSNY